MAESNKHKSVHRSRRIVLYACAFCSPTRYLQSCTGFQLVVTGVFILYKSAYLFYKSFIKPYCDIVFICVHCVKVSFLLCFHIDISLNLVNYLLKIIIPNNSLGLSAYDKYSFVWRVGVNEHLK